MPSAASIVVVYGACDTATSRWPFALGADISGGNARKITFELPAQIKIVSNAAGVTGGVRLWEPELDELLMGEPNAQRGALSERSQ